MTERMLRRCVGGAPLQLWRAALFQRRRRRSAGARRARSGKGSTHLIKVAVEAAVGKRDHVAVFGTDYPTPDGTCIRDYIHVSDLAAAHVAALEWLIAQPGRESRHELRLRHAGCRCCEVLDAVDRRERRADRAREMGRAAGDPPQLVAGNRRLLETLDWRPAHADIDTIVGDALAWERKLAGHGRSA